MKITTRTKRGFTLVELIVVIAIVAILAAVSVVSYMAFINQANISNDMQIVKELNIILAGDEAMHGTRDTYHEVLDVVGDNGFLVEKLTPRTNGYRIVYDRAHNRFALLDTEDKVAYEDQGVRHYEYVLGEVWNIVNKGETLSDKFANYLGESYELADGDNIQIKTGLDVGHHTERLNVTYVGQSTHQHAIVRTMGGTFVCNNGNDDVTHYGLVTEATVEDVKAGTYKEFGTVGRLYYDDEDGKIAIGAKDNSAVFCYMNKTADATANKENVAAVNATVYTWVDSNSGQASGYAHDEAEHPVTVTSNEVSVASCQNHNGVDNYEIVRINDLQYIICKSCGGFALYEGDNQTPVEASEEIEESGEPFDYNPINLNQKYGFHDSYVDGDHWVHEIEHKSEFRNIISHINNEAGNTDQSVDLADENTVYLVKTDINFGGTLWSGSEEVNQTPFTGKLIGDSETNVVLKNVELQPKASVIRGDWYSAGGLFKWALNATFKNITLDNFTLNTSNAKGCGLFLAGNNEALATNDKILFDHCVINSNCSINASANCGGFIGSSRGIADIEFNECTNNANIICSSTNVGSFIGTGTTTSSSGTNNLKFTDCTNNGIVMGSDYVGGFTGNTGNGSRTLTGTGNLNTADVYVISAGTNYGMFFPGNSWFKTTTSSFSGQMTGKLRVGSPAGGFEKSHLVDFNYNIIDGNSVAITSSNYTNYTVSFTLVNLDISFDENDMLKIGNSVDCDRIVVNIRQHGLRISKLEWWEYDTDKYTNEMGGSEQSETYAYMASLSFDSISNVNVKKVTQCGYFIPAGANNPQASYGAGFDTFKLDLSLFGTAGYENGYHFVNGVAYIVVENNDPAADQYLAICDWRNDIQYEVTAYKNGALVGNDDAINWGRGSGDATLLTAISL